ncbi:hypothetical protein [Streptomyces cinereoruber]|uniref:hypothetical protein n=1 Tax=Streptomyces cinereoruber TaxID=67260 RepID=UPI0036367D9B
MHDWLERDQGLRAGAVPVTLLLLAVVVIWVGFLPFRTDRHFVVDVPAVHPQTVSWWIWHTALVTLLSVALLILPGIALSLLARMPDPAP